MSDTVQPFDYRKIIDKADWYSARHQAEFDTINRIVALTDGIPFATLYAEPLSKIIPLIKSNLDRIRNDADTYRQGLIAHPDEVERILDSLQNMGGNLSFLHLAHCDKKKFPEELDTLLYELNQRHDIPLPMPSHSDTEDYLRSLRDLVDHAGKRTIRDVFEKPEKSFKRDEWSAIYYARKAGILNGI